MKPNATFVSFVNTIYCYENNLMKIKYTKKSTYAFNVLFRIKKLSFDI